MPKIVALDAFTLNPGDNPWTAVEALGEFVVYPRSSPAEVVPRSIDAEILVINKVPLSAATLAALPKLTLIAVTATGYNIVDTAAAAERGVVVCNVPEYGTDSVAQFVFALLLELCHHVAKHDAAVKAGEWTASPDFCLPKTPLIQLAGLTMGIVGFGRIGTRVAEMAHTFGMNILAARREGSTGGKPGYRIFQWGTIDEVFSKSDVVSLHCPLTPDTKGLVDERRLSLMKPGAMLINTSRGALVNEPDLANALKQGKPAAAAVDVTDVEPIRADNPLLTAPNCIITPHIAWATLAARQKLMTETAANIAAYLKGKPVNAVGGT